LEQLDRIQVELLSKSAATCFKIKTRTTESKCSRR